MSTRDSRDSRNSQNCSTDPTAPALSRAVAATLPAISEISPLPVHSVTAGWESPRPATSARATEHPDSATRRLDTTLGGKYRIDRLLGEGGCGRVYLATHLSLRAQVAIKFLLSHWASRAVFRERFRREARALALLSHPGIVRVHDFGEDAGDMYLVMEYVRGESLSELVLKDGQCLPPEQATDYIDQILEVLAIAHERGIVHRDLKPANVMVCQDRAPGAAPDALSGRIKVLDFGMAYVEDPEDSQRLTETGVVFGSLHYMSPEHCRGQDIGPASDIYSVGVMLYELLAGRVPFDRKNPVELMTHHLFVTPPSLDEIRGRHAVAPELAALAMWALAKKPEKRPTAVQFRQALRHALNKTDPVSAAHRSSDERIVAAGLPRSERALSPAKAFASTLPNLEPVVDAGPNPLVVLWGFEEEAASTMQSALAVNRLDGVRWPAGQVPPERIDDQPVRAVLLPDRGWAVAQVTALRKNTSSRPLPVLVIQVAQAGSIPELIRVGASDVALASTETGDICRKVWRMVRKGR